MAIKMSKKAGKVKKVIKKIVKAKPRTIAKSGAARATTNSVAMVKQPTGKYFESVGRRKVAVARVRIYEGSSEFVINGKTFEQYFAGIRKAAAQYTKPFVLTNTKDKFGVSAQVKGSGLKAQLDAVVHGVTRALVKFQADFKPLLKQEGLLTRDDRMKETRKIGMGGKARRKRQSPKR